VATKLKKPLIPNSYETGHAGAQPTIIDYTGRCLSTGHDGLFDHKDIS